MSDRSLRDITGCCERCGATLRRGRPRETYAGATLIVRRDGTWCPRCDATEYAASGTLNIPAGTITFLRGNITVNGGAIDGVADTAGNVTFKEPPPSGNVTGGSTEVSAKDPSASTTIRGCWREWVY